MLGWEFPPFISGGLGVHCFELCRQLALRGHSIDFFLPKHSQTPLVPHENVNLIEVPFSVSFTPYSRPASVLPGNYGSDFLSQVKAYSSAAAEAVVGQRKKYDLVHNHDWMTVEAAGAVKNVLGLPLVFTVHSTEYDRSPTPWGYLLDLEKQGVKQSDLVITVSERMKQRLVELGADATRTRVVYNGVDFSKYQLIRPSGKKFFTVLFLGRLVPQKGPEFFLRAAQRVLEKKDNVRFVLVGEGSMLPVLIQLSFDLGIHEHVQFTGFVPEEIQRKAYSSSDVFVMPSVSEPFGITALEAMASGTPCIVSKTSGVSEIALNCLKVDFWDVDKMARYIIACLEYPELSSVLSALERNEAASFNWDSTAEKTESAYKEVLANCGVLLG